MAPVKTRDRQWYDVGIFKNNSATVNQFYLLPEETLSNSNKVAANFSLTDLAHRCFGIQCSFICVMTKCGTL